MHIFEYTWYRRCRIIAACILVIFSSNSVCAEYATTMLDIPAPKILPNIHIPKEYGYVRESFESNKNTPPIILVENAHANPTVQHNIEQILGALTQEKTIRTVCLEGAEGDIDFSLYQAYPLKEIIENMAAEFLEKGILTGVEAFGLTNSYATKFTGIEEETTYLRHVRACIQSVKYSTQAEEIAKYLDKERNSTLKTIPSQHLKNILNYYIDYRLQRIEPLAYYHFLISQAYEHKISLHEYSSINKLQDIARYRTHIDFSKIQEQTQMIITVLTQDTVMTQREIEELACSELDCKAGRISRLEFLQRVKESANKYNIDLDQYAHFKMFFYYRWLIKEIEFRSLEQDCKRLEKTIINTLTKDDLTRDLIGYLKESIAAQKMLLLEATPDDVDIIVQNDVSRLWTRLFDDYGNSKIAHAVLENAVLFYSLAAERDKVIAQNVIECSEKALSTKPIVLIAGGYHTAGITRYLKEGGYSYTVVTPHVTNNPGIDTYKNIMDSFGSVFGVYEGKSGATVETPLQLARYHDSQLEEKTYFSFRERMLQEMLKALDQHPQRAHLFKEWNDKVTTDVIVHNDKTDETVVIDQKVLLAKLKQDGLPRLITAIETHRIPHTVRFKDTQDPNKESDDKAFLPQKDDIVSENSISQSDLSGRINFVADTQKTKKTIASTLGVLLPFVTSISFLLLVSNYIGVTYSNLFSYSFDPNNNIYFAGIFGLSNFASLFSNAQPLDYEILHRVKSIKRMKLYQAPHRSPGKVEKNKVHIITAAAQAAMSALPYFAENDSNFNQMRANERASIVTAAALKRFFNSHGKYKGIIAVGERQRYGVPGLVTKNTEFKARPFDDQITLDITVDVLESSKVIANNGASNNACVGTILGLAQQGDLYGLPDELHFYKRILRPYEGDKQVDLDLDRPITEVLHDISQALNKPIDDIKVAVLCRPRNKHLIEELINAGIKVTISDYHIMAEKGRQEGIFKNGNLYVLHYNDFFPLIGLYTGKIDCILGIGRPTEGQNMLMIHSIMGGDMRCALASYDALAGQMNVDILDEYAQFSEEEISVLRRNEILAEKNTQWTPYTPQDAGIAIAFTKKLFWDTDVRAVTVDDEAETVTVDVFWAGASGEAELVRITFETRIAQLKRKIDFSLFDSKKILYLEELAYCYMRLRLFDRAKATIDKTFHYAHTTKQLNRSLSIAYLIEAASVLAHEKDKEKMVHDAVMLLSRAIAAWNENREARRLLRRLLNHLADSSRVRAEKMEEGMQPTDDEILWENYIFARMRFKQVLALFPEYCTDSKTFSAALGDAQSEMEKEIIHRDLLEYELAKKQLEILELKFEYKEKRYKDTSANAQVYYKKLADSYKQIAEAFDIYGLSERAVEYRGRAFDVYDLMSRRFGHRVPADTIKAMAHNYQRLHQYEAAARTYGRLIDPEGAFQAYTGIYEIEDSIQLKKDFLDGFYYILDCATVLPEYVYNMQMIKTNDNSFAAAQKESISQWVALNKDLLTIWAQAGYISSSGEGSIIFDNGKGKPQELSEKIIALSKAKGEKYVHVKERHNLNLVMPGKYFIHGNKALKKILINLANGKQHLLKTFYDDITYSTKGQKDLNALKKHIPALHIPYGLRIVVTPEVVETKHDYALGFYSHAPPVRKYLMNVFRNKYTYLFSVPTIVMPRSIFNQKDDHIRQEYLYRLLSCLPQEQAIANAQRYFPTNYRYSNAEAYSVDRQSRGITRTGGKQYDEGKVGRLLYGEYKSHIRDNKRTQKVYKAYKRQLEKRKHVMPISLQKIMGRTMSRSNEKGLTRISVVAAILLLVGVAFSVHAVGVELFLQYVLYAGFFALIIAVPLLVVATIFKRATQFNVFPISKDASKLFTTMSYSALGNRMKKHIHGFEDSIKIYLKEYAMRKLLRDYKRVNEEQKVIIAQKVSKERSPYVVRIFRRKITEVDASLRESMAKALSAIEQQHGNSLRYSFVGDQIAKTVEAVSKTNHPEALLPYKESPYPEVRQELIKHITKSKIQSLYNLLLEIMKEDSDPRVRVYATRSIAHIGHSVNVEEALREVQYDQDNAVAEEVEKTFIKLGIVSDKAHKEYEEEKSVLIQQIDAFIEEYKNANKKRKNAIINELREKNALLRNVPIAKNDKQTEVYGLYIDYLYDLFHTNNIVKIGAIVKEIESLPLAKALIKAEALLEVMRDFADTIRPINLRMVTYEILRLEKFIKAHKDAYALLQRAMDNTLFFLFQTECERKLHIEINGTDAGIYFKEQLSFSVETYDSYWKHLLAVYGTYRIVIEDPHDETIAVKKYERLTETADRLYSYLVDGIINDRGAALVRKEKDGSFPNMRKHIQERLADGNYVICHEKDVKEFINFLATYVRTEDGDAKRKLLQLMTKNIYAEDGKRDYHQSLRQTFEQADTLYLSAYLNTLAYAAQTIHDLRYQGAQINTFKKRSEQERVLEYLQNVDIQIMIVPELLLGRGLAYVMNRPVLKGSKKRVLRIILPVGLINKIQLEAKENKTRGEFNAIQLFEAIILHELSDAMDGVHNENIRIDLFRELNELWKEIQLQWQNDMYAEAKASSERGDARRAFLLYTKITQSNIINEKTADSYYRVGVVLANRGKTQAAIYALNQACETYKVLIDTHQGRRDSLQELHDRFANTTGYLGFIYLDAKHYSEALEYSEKALAFMKEQRINLPALKALIEAQCAQIYLGLFERSKDQGFFSRAVEYINSALSVLKTLHLFYPDPSVFVEQHSKAYLIKAQIYGAKENYILAEQFTRKALDKNPALLQAKLLLVQTLREQEKYKEALEVLDEIGKQSLDTETAAWCNYERGKIAYIKKDIEKARTFYKNASDLFDLNDIDNNDLRQRILFERGHMAYRTGDYQEAQMFLEKSLRVYLPELAESSNSKEFIEKSRDIFAQRKINRAIEEKIIHTLYALLRVYRGLHKDTAVVALATFILSRGESKERPDVLWYRAMSYIDLYAENINKISRRADEKEYLRQVLEDLQESALLFKTIDKEHAAEIQEYANALGVFIEKGAQGLLVSAQENIEEAFSFNPYDYLKKKPVKKRRKGKKVESVDTLTKKQRIQVKVKSDLYQSQYERAIATILSHMLIVDDLYTGCTQEDLRQIGILLRDVYKLIEQYEPKGEFSVRVSDKSKILNIIAKEYANTLTRMNPNIVITKKGNQEVELTLTASLSDDTMFDELFFKGLSELFTKQVIVIDSPEKQYDGKTAKAINDDLDYIAEQLAQVRGEDVFLQEPFETKRKNGSLGRLLSIVFIMMTLIPRDIFAADEGGNAAQKGFELMSYYGAIGVSAFVVMVILIAAIVKTVHAHVLKRMEKNVSEHNQQQADDPLITEALLLKRFPDHFKESVDHGLQHARDLKEKAMILATQLRLRNQIDWDVLTLAIYAHDLFAYKGEAHGNEAAEFIRAHFSDVLTPAQLDLVCQAIILHDDKTVRMHDERLQASIEAQILFDIDNWDAFGVKGVYRYIMAYRERGFNLEDIQKRVLENIENRYNNFIFNETGAISSSGYLVAKSFFRRLKDNDHHALYIYEALTHAENKHPVVIAREKLMEGANGSTYVRSFFEMLIDEYFTSVKNIQYEQVNKEMLSVKVLAHMLAKEDKHTVHTVLSEMLDEALESQKLLGYVETIIDETKMNAHLFEVADENKGALFFDSSYLRKFHSFTQLSSERQELIKSIIQSKFSHIFINHDDVDYFSKEEVESFFQKMGIQKEKISFVFADAKRYTRAGTDRLYISFSFLPDEILTYDRIVFLYDSSHRNSLNFLMQSVAQNTVSNHIRLVESPSFMASIELADVVVSIEKIYKDKSIPQKRYFTMEALNAFGLYFAFHKGISSLGAFLSSTARDGSFTTPFKNALIEKIDDALCAQKMKIFA